MKQYDFDLRDYWRIIKKRKVIIILTVLIIGVFSFAFAKMQAPIPLYETSAKVKFEQSSSMSGLFIKTLTFSSWDALSTQLSVVTSFPVMSNAAKELGLVDRNLSLDQIRRSEANLKVIMSLQAAVRAEQAANTSIIDITATSASPDMAQKLANSTARAYHDYNVQEANKRAIEATSFIKNQVTKVRERLQEAEDKVRKFREENALIAADLGSSRVANQLATVETELDKTLSQLKAVNSLLKQLESGRTLQMDAAVAAAGREGQPAKGDEPTSGLFRVEEISPNLSRLNNLLLDTLMKRRTMLMDLTPENPEVLASEREAEAIKREIFGELKARRTTLQRRRKFLLDRLVQIRAKTSRLPEKMLTMVRLEREVSLNSELYTLLSSKLQEALIQLSEQVEEVTIITPAVRPSIPINPPRIASKATVGLIIGLILGLIFAFVSETLDTSIATVEDVEEYLGLPVLGMIPYLEKGGTVAKGLFRRHGVTPPEGVPREGLMEMISHYAPKSVISESFRTLRTNVEYICRKEGVKVFINTSSSLREGKTANSLNLAISMAQAGKKTCLIEADLRRPGVHRVFKLQREPGLSDLLMGGYKIPDVIRTINDFLLGGFTLEEITATSGLENLHIITAGASVLNPAEILGSPQMIELLEQLKKEYDFVLLDTPPVLPVADTTILAPKVDGTLLIYQVGQIARGVLKRAKLQLDNVRANMYGIILNNVRAETSPDYYHYQMRYYYGEEMPAARPGILGRLMFWRRTDLGPATPKPERPKAVEEPPPAAPARKFSNIVKIALLVLALLVLGVGLYLKLSTRHEPQPRRPAAKAKTRAKAARVRVKKARAKTGKRAVPKERKIAKARETKSAAPAIAAKPQGSAVSKKPAPKPRARALVAVSRGEEAREAAARPASSVSAAAPSRGLYHLQLGVFKSSDSAIHLADEVAHRVGTRAKINSFRNRQGIEIFVVYLEKRVGYREGLGTAKELLAKGYESIIVHYRKIPGSRVYP